MGNTGVLALAIGGPILSAFTGGLAGAYLSQRWTDRREEKKIEDEIKSSVFFIVAELNNFIEKCSSVRVEYENYQNSNGNAGDLTTRLPTLEEFPSWIRWTTLGPEIARNILALRVEIARRQGIVRDQFELCGPEEAFETAADEAILLASSTLTIAKALDTKYDLPSVDKEANWTSAAYIEKALKAVQDKAAARAKRTKSLKYQQHVDAMTRDADSIEPAKPVVQPSVPKPPRKRNPSRKT